MKKGFGVIALLLALPALAEEGFPVTTAPLEQVEVQATVQAYGRVTERPHYLYFEVGGNLARLHADVGDHVTADQLLAELDTRDIDSELEQAEEAVKHGRIKYQQYRELSSHNAASRDQLEDWRHEYELAKLRLTQLREDRTKYLLPAPADGQVADRLVDFPGPVGADTAIFQLRSSTHPLLVSADLTQREVADVRVGDRAVVTLPELPQATLGGHVTKIRPGSLDNGLFSVDIAVDLPPGGASLKEGMQVEVAITAGEAHTGYALPITALLSIEGETGRFFVVDDGKAKSVSARLTRIDGDRVLLGGDLPAYRRVVVRGQYQLTDGAPLNEAAKESSGASP